MKNFTNGALVFRIWRFDGSGEVIAKTQYTSDAETFAKMKAAEDGADRPNDSQQWFYLVACENECSVTAFQCSPAATPDR